MPSSDYSSLHADLLEVGKIVAQKLINVLSSSDYPKEMVSNVVIDDPVVEKKGRFSNSGHIDIYIDGKKAPMAAAFEWGSGEHATRGRIGTYKIEPKDTSVLKFGWQPDFVPWKSPKFAGVILEGAGTEGTYFFQWVDHPGIAPRPYLAQVIREATPEVVKVLSLGTTGRFLSGLRDIADGKFMVIS